MFSARPAPQKWIGRTIITRVEMECSVLSVMSTSNTSASDVGLEVAALVVDHEIPGNTSMAGLRLASTHGCLIDIHEIDSAAMSELGQDPRVISPDCFLEASIARAMICTD